MIEDLPKLSMILVYNSSIIQISKDHNFLYIAVHQYYNYKSFRLVEKDVHWCLLTAGKTGKYFNITTEKILVMKLNSEKLLRDFQETVKGDQELFQQLL